MRGQGVRFRAVIAVLTALIASLSLVGQASAGKSDDPHPDQGQDGAARTKHENHCVTPSGVDLNETYGVEYQILAPFCQEADAGERWTTSGGWFMAKSFDIVPEGFEPRGATPLEDFLARFKGVRAVVDAGTRREQTFFLPTNENLFAGPHPAFPDDFDLVVAIPIGSNRPLQVGSHTVTVTWMFDGMHCDGLGDSLQDNCTPGGEFVFVDDLPIEVVSRN